MRQPNPVNIEMVKRVATKMGNLRKRFVFTGGAIVDLLITDPGAPGVRPTKDVDLIVEVASKEEYHGLRKPLLDLGFREDVQDENAPICRWHIEEVKVDIMPNNPNILGFAND